MKKYYFHPDAVAELHASVDYYENTLTGLGKDFAEEIYSAINLILQYPESWSKVTKNARRCLVNRFPYGVIYQVDNEEIYIIAIMHLHKKPNYWKKRS